MFYSRQSACLTFIAISLISFIIITSCSKNGTESGMQFVPGTYAGTSISAAYVANLISNYLAEHPEATREEVLKALKTLL